MRVPAANEVLVVTKPLFDFALLGAHIGRIGMAAANICSTWPSHVDNIDDWKVETGE